MSLVETKVKTYLAKPRIAFRSGLVGVISSIWQCSLPGTSSGWGNTPSASYENWVEWKRFDSLHNKLRTTGESKQGDLRRIET